MRSCGGSLRITHENRSTESRVGNRIGTTVDVVNKKFQKCTLGTYNIIFSFKKRLPRSYNVCAELYAVSGFESVQGTIIVLCPLRR